MALRHAAALVLFAAFIHVAGAPAHSQSGTITNPPKIIVPAAALPDMAITNMQTTPVCTPKGTTTANIKVTVTNIGKATADLSKITWAIIVSADWWPVTYELLAKTPPPALVWPQAGGPTAFTPGQSWTTTLTINGIPAMKKNAKVPGQHGVMAHVDPNNKLPESDEKNNSREFVFFDPCFYVK
jgi:hypothetical protein